MNFRQKTKAQLIEQLMNISQQMQDFKMEKTQIESSLWERIKELNCLYSIAELNEKNHDSIEKILSETVNILPGSWQYPEITCARIKYEQLEFKSSLFNLSQWKQSMGIFVDGVCSGKVEVYYLKAMPVIDEGPFLKEERSLINAIAERLGRVIERINAKKQLMIERESLKNVNIALEQVLKKMKEEQKEIGRSIQANMENILMPIIHNIEIEGSEIQQKYIKLLKQNLKEIISPFSVTLSDPLKGLTPTEIQICHLIKSGLSTKEIAKLRHVSNSTVNRHREHIRKKMGIQNQKLNLTSYLCSIISDGEDHHFQTD
jgi:DNA-binding CsgD family transcriptional regulator